jgi:diguanylate cyclase (GGDEF)-like protein
MSAAAKRDLVGLSLIGLTFYVLAIRFNLFEGMVRFYEEHEAWQIDEIALAVTATSLGLIVFSMRRMREAMREVTLRLAAEEQTRAMATHDPLTGLPNRRKLQHDLEQALKSARAGGSVGVALVDLDRFKPVNDLFGHAVGDELLIALAAILMREAGPRGFAARIGGDEFVIVWTELQDADDLISKLTRLSQCLEAPVAINDNQITVGASIGVSLAHAAQSGKEALRRADIALFRVKDEGRGGFAFFDDSMDAKVQERHAMEREIRSAMARNTIEPYYQALVHLESGKAYGYEVLARLYREDGEIIAPDSFIPLTEEIGLIGDMTLNLLRKGCADVRDWPGAPLLSINISPVQMRDTHLAQKVLRVLLETGFPPQRLQVEITENALIADLEQARVLLTSLRNQGVLIALDDFGTGYSSLRHLRELPFDNLKIDRSFVQSMETSTESETIVHTILDLAANLGLAVTAEGIETAFSAEHLKALGCANGQGFLFGKPTGAAHIRQGFAAAGDKAGQKRIA